MDEFNFIGRPKTTDNKKVTLFKPVKPYNKTKLQDIDKRKLSWPQAIVRYPKIKAYGDADKDGFLNAWDCKPFDEKKHGALPVPVIQSAAIGVLAAAPLLLMDKKRQMYLKEMERRKFIDRQRAEYKQKRIEQWKAAMAKQRARNIYQELNNRPETYNQIRAKAWQKSKPVDGFRRPLEGDTPKGRGSTVARTRFDPAREGVKFN